MYGRNLSSNDLALIFKTLTLQAFIQAFIGALYDLETKELTSIIGRPPTILERLYYWDQCWQREYQKWWEDRQDALRKIRRAVWNNPSDERQGAV